MTAPRGHKLTDAEFRDAHARRLTVRQVAALNGTYEAAIVRRARRLEIRFCNKCGPKPNLDKQEKARELRTQGLSFEKIGAQVGCSPSAAWWWCQ